MQLKSVSNNRGHNTADRNVNEEMLVLETQTKEIQKAKEKSKQTDIISDDEKTAAN